MTSEQRALRETVASLLEKRSPEPRVRELMATDSGYDETTWQELADMGLLGLAIPEEFGGTGAGHTELGIVAEEMGAALLCAPFLSTAVLAPALIRAVGHPATEDDVLAGIASGSLIVTLAYAEGTSVLVPSVVTTRAEEGSGGWELSGTKNYVLDGLAADLFYVLADTGAGPAVFAVERGAAGLVPTPLETVDMTRKQCTLRLHHTPARLVGETGCGALSFAEAIGIAGVALISEQAGGTHRAMQMGADYARTRFQFGRAIGSFQAVKHMCADMLTEAESAISAARHVAASFDAAAPTRLADLALAQAYCAEAFVFVAATNIQVHGGIGFTWEHPAHLYLRRARTDAQLLGAAAYHRERYLALKEV
ncbi:MAG TPA: acyl-CoA dehydrogenase family protein [Mycobacterium sp.]|nr:acyl-CoA dehydrogenase family protein [Mycobacterium sp.]